MEITNMKICFVLWTTIFIALTNGEIKGDTYKLPAYIFFGVNALILIPWFIELGETQLVIKFSSTVEI